MFIIYIFCLIHTNTYSSYSHILMYDNNIKIKSYVSIIRCNKDNKKLNCIKKLKENTHVILFK